MRTTWVDLTDLFEWKGHFTGIQRVTYSYSLRLSKEGAKFFVYSSLYNRFVEVSLDLIKVQAGENIESHKLSKRQILKRKLKKKYVLLPRWVQKASRPVLLFANKEFRKFAAIILDNKERDYVLRKLPTAEFHDGDLLLVLGAGWNSEGLIKQLAKQKQSKKLKILLHLNDILPIYQPHLFAKDLPQKFTKYVNSAIRISDVITVISKATKNDVTRYCIEHNVKAPPINILRLGEDLKATNLRKPAVTIEGRFILAVGTFEIRKNYILLYQVVKLAKVKGKKIPQIVIAGRKGWLTEDLLYVLNNDPEVESALIILNEVSDSNLAWLYENCLFTVFCSVAEGWGLPIAESLQHGKFCISSNTSSMTEIAGSKIAYFNPYDAGDCLEKIVTYSETNSVELDRIIKNSYKPMTWDSSFRDLMAAVVSMSHN